LEVAANLGSDNILITDDGYENLTPTPKEIDEIVKIIKEG
jgi:Xaa-Pro dipeptidase